MRPKPQLKYILALNFGLCIGVTFGHDVPVHQAITLNAAESAYGVSSTYVSFIDVIASDLSYSGPLGVTNAIFDGSGFEDNIDIKGDAGGKRSLNHFYDPLGTTSYGKGLSDSLGFTAIGLSGDKRALIGTNSFAWASISNCTGINFPGERIFFWHLEPNKNTINVWSWQNARGYERLGLTATNQLERQNNLLFMFRAVGQVMHLLEDTSQPQHVRNEQHADPFQANSAGEHLDPWASPIEIYGNKNSDKLNYQHAMLDWRGAGFAKLEDFWDRHKYNGNSAALNDAEAGSANTLGLAEWCNGNFLGARHLYPEYYPNGSADIRYYPYPSRNHSTDYLQKSANLALGMRTLTLRNGQQGQAVYVNKTGDGVTYDSISRFDYFGAKFPRSGMMTIRDDRVLSNYHNVFIPKAVEYSAGLLDYFFRGTIDVQVSWNTNLLYFTNIVMNTSGQDFHGGAFFLYQDDVSANRTLLWQTNLADLVVNGTLTNGASLDILAPGSPTNKLLMVYQGTIGYSNGAALDPVDASIAVAAARPWVYEQITTNSYQIPVPNPYYDETITTNLESGDFGFPLVAGNYEVIVNYAKFDDTGTIGSLTCHDSVNPSCSLPDEIANAVVPVSDITITPDGRHLSVRVTATDDPLCKYEVGWYEITIIWRVLPGQ